MAKSITELSVFISCPNDMNELRGVAEAAIREIAATLRITSSIDLVPVSWERDLLPGVATSAQQVINRQTDGQYDVYLGILGAKFGSPTSRAGSGTEEEFSLALARFRDDSSAVRLLFYFQAFGVNPLSVEPDQLQRVLEFRSNLSKSGVLYRELSSLDDALTAFKRHLLSLVEREWDTVQLRWRADLPVAPFVGGENEAGQSQVERSFNEVATELIADTELEDLGLIEISLSGTQELYKAGESMRKLGEGLDLLTKQMQERVSALNLKGLRSAVDVRDIANGFASDMDEYVQNARGDLANGRFHLFRGIEFTEAYYKQTREAGFVPAEPVSELIDAATRIEPSLRRFRSGSRECRESVSRLPPLTKRFKLSKRSLADFFDAVSVEITIYLERLALMRSRLADWNEPDTGQ